MKSRLLNVAAELRRLEQVVADKEWEDQDSRTERQELAHYRELHSNGILWEPLF